jgi:nucleoside-diphosphate-sugar epimerase
MSTNLAFDPVLVTGASGFIGSCAVHALVERGYRPHVLLRNPATAWRLFDILDRIEVHKADLVNAADVAGVVAEVRPAAVAHLAVYGAYEDQADAPAILRTNVLGSCHLLQASVQAGVRAFVNAGSTSEYGFSTKAMAEADRLDPNSFYAVSKAAQTHLATYMARRHKMGLVTYRLFSVYGPWEEPTRLMPTLIRRIRAGLPLEMVSPETARDFVYVEDVLDVLLDFETAARLSGEVLNLGTGVECSLRTVVEVAQRVVGRQVEVRWGSMAARHWDSCRWEADPTRARQVLGWAPRHNLEQGLEKMARWMQARGDYEDVRGWKRAG